MLLHFMHMCSCGIVSHLLNHAVVCTSAAARAETFSPSKGELLANLKRRQIEKRANSANIPLRGGADSSVPSPLLRHGADSGKVGEWEAACHEHSSVGVSSYVVY